MKLLELRKGIGLTVAQVADAMNVSKMAVYKWEKGLALPGADKLPALADLFGCTIDDLYGREPPQAAS